MGWRKVGEDIYDDIKREGVCQVKDGRRTHGARHSALGGLMSDVKRSNSHVEHANPVYQIVMTLKNKSKIEVFLTIEQKARVRAHAAKAGISMAEVIKRALEGLLK